MGFSGSFENRIDDLDTGNCEKGRRDRRIKGIEARKLGLPEDRLRLVEGNGIAAIGRELANLSREEASVTFLHADPYQPLDRPASV